MRSILTVSTAASSYNLTDLSAVKTELGITSTTEDDKITSWIQQASAFIARYCGRVFAEETLSEQFRLSREESVLQLSRWPVSSITSVTQDTDSALASTDYELDPDKGQVTRLVSALPVTWTAQKIVVVYVAGYELLGDLPYEIERAAILLVKQYRSASTRDPMLKSEEIPGVLSSTFWVGGPPGGVIPPEIAALLDPYREFTV